MQHEMQVSILKELLQQLDDGMSVDAGVQYKNPTAFYTCPDQAQKEWALFFRNHPQLIGLSGDLPTPGSFVTTEDFGVPVLATRDKDGQFRAFVNACRHRGSQVATEERGEASRFICPFHNWTYSPAGKLVGIPREKDFGKIDRSCHGLIELPAVEQYGTLWVHPNAAGKLDVDTLLGDFAPEIENWDIGRLHYRGVATMDKRLNWKLANDTFGETYHFSRLHGSTLNNIFYGDALAYEANGRNHRFVFPSRSIDLLRTLPEDQWDMEGMAVVLYYFFPNIQMTVNKENVTIFKIYPDKQDIGRSITRVCNYISPELQESMDTGARVVIDETNVYDQETREGGDEAISPEAVNEIVNSTLEQEDYYVGEMAQKTIASGALEYMVFGRNEPALHHFHTNYRDALGLPPLEQL